GQRSVSSTVGVNTQPSRWIAASETATIAFVPTSSSDAAPVEPQRFVNCALPVLAQPTYGRELCHRTRKFAFGAGDLFLGCPVLHRFLGRLLGLKRLGFV